MITTPLSGQTLREFAADQDIEAPYHSLTIGSVVDTNDPQQMGRLRVICPELGDSQDKLVKNIPWAMYVSPFGGVNTIGSRGPEDGEENTTVGGVTYGMWAIPKVGSHVLVGCIDGNTELRFWLGCIFPQSLTHTLPHGRYTFQKDNGLEDEPSGPLSSSERPIEPLHSKQTEAFTPIGTSRITGAATEPRKNFEYRTRGADCSAARVDPQLIGTVVKASKQGDDRDLEFTEPDGNVIISNQGYVTSRLEPDLEFPETTGRNFDSTVYSMTTPGFHGFSMDDNPQNCRIRLRTCGGTQIIMDDTNERMYISVAGGKAYIEIDQSGNIDIYGSRNISLRASEDINITTDKTFRVHAKQGIHMFSEKDMRLHSVEDMNFRSDKNIRSHSGESTFLQAGEDLNLKAGDVANYTSGSTTNILAGGNIIETGSNIHLNGPTAATAANADEKHSFFTSRVPEHEPWGRIMMDPKFTDKDQGNQFKSEFTYNDPNVGKTERGESITRNSKWHR
ncbi:MAG: hypothetical protein ACREAU_02090 [Nitrosopumilaceae archaeon]